MLFFMFSLLLNGHVRIHYISFTNVLYNLIINYTINNTVNAIQSLNHTIVLPRDSFNSIDKVRWHQIAKSKIDDRNTICWTDIKIKDSQQVSALCT